MPHIIRLFMWGYQSHFCTALEVLARNVFEKLGAEIEPKAFLVGLRRPNTQQHNPVCVEPEDGEWAPALFDGLEEAVQAAIPHHPLQGVLYGDEASNFEAPTRIRQGSITNAVLAALAAEDRRLGQKSFACEAYPVGDYDVVCIVQIPAELLAKFPPIAVSWQHEPYETSLVHSCIGQILEEARRGLTVPEPGRFLYDVLRSADEVIRRAASLFMRTSHLPGKFCLSDMFEDVNRLSQARYEGRSLTGRIVVASADDPNLDYVMKFATPVLLANTRWARKLLQMATRDVALLTEYGTILGLGRVSDVSAPPYAIDFLDHHQWEFRRGDQALMRCQFGEARLPQEPIGKERFEDNMRRVFKGIGEPAVNRYLKVLDLLTRFGRGSSLVIAADAKVEAERLSQQGTLIAPAPLTSELLERATTIDGTILADPDGVCHAIGVILDGPTVAENLPARGARFNSALRYVTDSTEPRMAFILSEDRTLDVVPLLRPRVERVKLEAMIVAIEAATLDTYHKPRNFLDHHRFYLDAAQCARINEALERIENEPHDLGRIILVTSRFTPHPAMNDSYLK